MFCQNILNKNLNLIIYSIRIKMKAVANIQDLPYPGVLTQ